MLSAVEAMPANSEDEDSDWQRHLQDWSYPPSPAQPLASHQYSSGSIHFSEITDAHGASHNNEAPASIHHDLGSTQSSFQWQGSPSSSGQAQSWRGPATSSPSTPHNLVHSPQEISQADLDFLHRILSETEDRIEPSGDSQQPSNVGIIASRSSQDQRQRPRRSRMNSLPIRASVKDTTGYFTSGPTPKRKTLRRWPEPEFLNRISYQPGTRFDGGQLGNLVMDAKSGLVSDLSSRLFAGKLHVVDDPVLNYLRADLFYKKWPIERPSRRLPLVTTTAADGTKLRIHMTLHNSSTSSKYLKGTVLQDRPYYMVYGVPELLRAKDNPIVYYGAGYLDPEDNSEVDSHFSSVLAKEAGEIHL
ncbi:hypothetical protein PHSY_000606 [Pseudozyma hubeiensis SY62]|uniref:Uncharacterized protein n=1 Tax=Pseudozyma hubeiensis (strain SY62) TaxID=1305764 RepID=R9P4L2_PSEHS|nr:hypothetical protein PHSY_000606 [Pseudozyma hubeiensis SY62]GAC93045.1 hypothetical protein PHSY_000606 [Pseudozyma hubeiensis SY62]